MAPLIFVLCALTSLACAVLLVRGYGRTRSRLLLWSALCFFGLTVQNVILFVDLVVVPDLDLSVLRNAIGLAALCLLLFGLIWERE
jgi:hypothetical protein